jgi:multidrug efflux pump subunit AcrA (membrane-fusion protein)
LLSLLVAVGLPGCSRTDPEPAFSAAASLVERGPEDAPAELPVAGPIAGAPAGAYVTEAQLESPGSRDVTFEVPGRVEQVLAAVGDRVRAGQILATLETADREARLADSRTRWRSAVAAAPVAEDGSGRPAAYMVEEMEERLQRAREAARENPQDLAAIRAAMVREGQEAAADRAIAIARVRTDRPDATAARRNAQDAMSRALMSELAQRVANLEAAIRQSRLVSPVDGTVVAVNVRPQQDWQSRDPTPAFVVADASRWHLRAPVPADRARSITATTVGFCELSVPGERPAVVPCPVVAMTPQDAVVPAENGRPPTRWREVTFEIQGTLPVAARFGDPVRVAVGP